MMRMKKMYFFSVTLAIFLSVVVTVKLVSFSIGAPTNASGSPGNNNLTCVQCHASNNNEKFNWITSTELDNGYVPGNLYNMKAKAEKAGCTKFGFLITAEKSDGTKAGAPVVSDAAKTQLSDTYYITHTQAGTAGQDSAVWNFKWSAPASPMGTVALYGAFIGADGNNQNSGDVVYVTKKTVVLFGTQGIPSTSVKSGVQMYTYPNPASSLVNFTLTSPVNSAQLSIFAPHGALVKRVVWDRADEMQADVSTLPPGTYFTRLEWDNDLITGKLVIRR